MAAQMEYVSKTQHYLKVKKPLLERQRRARVNKCLDALKTLVAEFQGDDAILRMDKAEMLESTIQFMRRHAGPAKQQHSPAPTGIPMDGFRNGYMNAVNEVSRVMAGTPGMSVDLGKTVMTRLGCEFNRLLQGATPHAAPAAVPTESRAPMSPASSGYHSDCDDSSMASPATNTATATAATKPVWRPW